MATAPAASTTPTESAAPAPSAGSGTRSALRGLRCRACGALQPADERYVCGECLGPIEPEYDLASFDTDALREGIERGPRSLWRYSALLPISDPPAHGAVGWTPLVHAPRLGAALGIERLYLKADTRIPT
ncbi:MAG: threonine synthase, partial [Chloroflexota bacterium]